MSDLFQCRAYAREVFNEFKLTGDAQHAARVAVPQMALLAAISACVALSLRRWPWEVDLETELPPPRGAPPALTTRFVAAGFVLALAVALPLVSLARHGLLLSAWSNLSHTVLAEQLRASLRYAGIGATTACLMGLLCALTAERAARGLRLPFYFLLSLPFAFPPTLYAIAVHASLNSRLGDWLADTSWPLGLALGARSAPIATLLIAGALRLAQRSAEDAARVEGESEWRAPMRVTLLPRSHALIAAWLLGFAFSLGDVAMSALLYPPGGQPMAVAIFDAMHYAHEPEVALLCLLLAACVTAPAALALVAARKSAALRG